MRRKEHEPNFTAILVLFHTTNHLFNRGRKSQVAYRFFPDGLPEVNLLEAAGGLVEDFLAVLEPEHFFAENEKLFRTGSGADARRGRKLSGVGKI